MMNPNKFIAFALKTRQRGCWTAKRGMYGHIAGIRLQTGELPPTPPTRIEPN